MNIRSSISSYYIEDELKKLFFNIQQRCETFEQQRDKVRWLDVSIKEFIGYLNHIHYKYDDQLSLLTFRYSIEIIDRSLANFKIRLRASIIIAGEIDETEIDITTKSE